MVKVCNDRFYLDGILKTTLDIYKKDVLRKDDDCFLIMDGAERGGKSTFANQIANYLDPSFEKEGLSRTVFNYNQFFEAVKNGEKGQCIIFDEAFGYLNSRSALSKFNKGLIKIMAEMGFKNLFVILCIPSYFELDRYPAIHRSRALIHIYKDKRTGQKGQFMFYNHEKKKKLYLEGKKGYNYNKQSANFFGNFSKYFSINKEEYDSKKRLAVFTMDEPMQKETPRTRDMLNALLFNLRHNFGWTLKMIQDYLAIYGIEIANSSLSLRITTFEAKWGGVITKTPKEGVVSTTTQPK